ncbi:MAG TPA: DUF4097 family beta strand repeat-containing protein [Verrucomicrobiae bacterium]|nr:DUF4097 family beta strand repeat-containing protein [Verrucomicrobiae bacterium]
MFSRRSALASVLAAACSIVLASAAYASGSPSDHRGSMTEEFHQTYPITPNGRVELDNINGDVHISSWDRNEVKVDAIKYADTKERLDEATIDVDSGKDYVSIKTRYRDHDLTFNWGSHNNPATVEYTITVPRNAALDKIELVNGALDVAGVSGEVRASSVNGRIAAHDLAGRTRLETVNGRLEASFNQLAGNSVELSSVNGSVSLTIPSDSQAELEASTVSGGIDNDFGLHVHHQFVGHDLRGQLGNGGTRIKLDDVNGGIQIHHAEDGRTLSPVKDLSHHNDDDDDSI